jgi:hypothetical protein
VFTAFSQAQTATALETDVLKPKVGHQGRALGARIESVEHIEDGKVVKIKVSIPAQDDSDIEEVVVLGQPEIITKVRRPVEQKQRFEVVKNLEQGRSGVIIYLGKRQDFALKLNYTEDSPDVEPDVYNR